MDACTWPESGNAGQLVQGWGYYEIDTGKSFGLRDKLKNYHPQGLVILPKQKKVVFSGKLIGKKITPPAQLIVFDMDLKELKRLTVLPELTNTGQITYIPALDKILGITDKGDKKLMYLFNVNTGRLELQTEFSAKNVSKVFFRPIDQSYWVIIDRKLNTLNPQNLSLTPVAVLNKDIKFPCWNGKELYGAVKGNLVRVEVK